MGKEKDSSGLHAAGRAQHAVVGGLRSGPQNHNGGRHWPVGRLPLITVLSGVMGTSIPITLTLTVSVCAL